MKDSSKMETKQQFAALTRKVNALEKRLNAIESAGAKPAKQKREPSAYNKFMSSENSKIRNANPTWDQADVMREVARRWNAQKK